MFDDAPLFKIMQPEEIKLVNLEDTIKESPAFVNEEEQR